MKIESSETTRQSSEDATTAPQRRAKGQKSEETRLRIVDAGAKIFALKGYAHARLGDVAEEANTHVGGIYYYYKSRDSLIMEIMRVAASRTADFMNDRIDELAPDAPFDAHVQAAVTGQLQAILATDYYTVAFLKIFPNLSEEMKETSRATLREFVDVWRKLIQRGQEIGAVDRDLDPAVVRMTVAGAIQWSAEWADASKSPPEVLAAQMTRIFLRGIKAAD